LLPSRRRGAVGGRWSWLFMRLLGWLLGGYWSSAHSAERGIGRNRSATAWAYDIVHRRSPWEITRKQIANGLQTPQRRETSFAHGVAGESRLQVLYSVLWGREQENSDNARGFFCDGYDSELPKVIRR
jgi:hypothetical protein